MTVTTSSLIAEASFRWGTPEWALPAALLLLLAIAAIITSYALGPGRGPLRLICAVLKGAAVAILAACLLEPMIHDERARPGANLFLVVADNSQSLTLRDAAASRSRGEELIATLAPEQAWQTRLAQEFDVRRYLFDSRLRPVAEFAQLSLDGAQTALVHTLATLDQRYEGRPVAGMLLLTDGNATDLIAEQTDWKQLPPVYPVVVGEEESSKDIAVLRVTVTQSNFEVAPTSVTAEVVVHGWQDEPVLVQLLDEQGRELQRQRVDDYESGRSFTLRFQLKPQSAGIGFFRVRAIAASDAEAVAAGEPSTEATLENNSHDFVVDPGQGPYRVLYVAGRPNWEFKFLRRAVEADNEVQLVGMVRIAKKEPKFAFRSRAGESSNPLFRGFGNQDAEEVEQYDEPVLLRYGIEDDTELRGGFPKSDAELFKYDAVILDDLEADFFTQDQMLLLQRFVTQRGGGFLMLGGKESFVQGGYRRTPIGEMLPVYLDRIPSSESPADFRFALTREGWLEPWVRLKPTESEERARLQQMPPFRTLNRVRSIKPAASVVAAVQDRDGSTLPAIVVQPFGKGRAASMMVGDFWRWHLKREESSEADAERFWRQVARWIVADVPRRVEVAVQRAAADTRGEVRLRVKARDESFQMLDNASVAITLTTPEGKKLELSCPASGGESGIYETAFVPSISGGYRAAVAVTAEDGSEVGRVETGWISDPQTAEFRRLSPNRAWLEDLAQATGGEVLRPDQLPAFVADLPNKKVPIVEPWSSPIWHKWTVLLLAVGLLVGEWGLRRWKGLP